MHRLGAHLGAHGRARFNISFFYLLGHFCHEGVGRRGANFGTFIFFSAPFLEFRTEGLASISISFHIFGFAAAYCWRSVDT